jgi:hypothetical protein
MEYRAVVVVSLLVVFGAVTPVAPATAQSDSGGDGSAAASVSISVDGTPLDSGEAYHTPTDPWLRVTVSADTPVSLVEVRVDGTTRHSFEPSSEAVDRSLPLELTTGDHRVTVVVTTDGTTTHEATITKDDADPVVTYEDPIEPAPLDDDIPTVTVENSTLTVAGTVEDASPIEYVRIDHAYEYERGASRDGDADDGNFAYNVDQAPFSPEEQLPVNTDDGDTNDDGDDDDVEGRDQHLLPSPGTRFNESLTLALGTNYLRIVVTDTAGNTAATHLAVTVNDDTRPTLNVTHIEYVSPTRLRITGRVTDEVGVNDVWLQEIRNTSDETEDVADTEQASDTDDDPDETQNVTVRHRLVFPQTTAPDRSRRNVSFETTVYHPPGDDTVVIGVNDTARNDRVRNYSLSTFLTPTIGVDDERTGYVDGGDVAVGGRVVDGQIDDVTVEAVAPSTGRIVDARPVDLGQDGTFRTRLAGGTDATRVRVRVRVRDVSGVEHVETVIVDEPVDDSSAVSTARSGDNGGRGDGTDADKNESDPPATVRIPVIGVTLAAPAVGIPGPLGASLSIPLPLVGPIDIPLAAVGVLLVLFVVVVARVR